MPLVSTSSVSAARTASPTSRPSASALTTRATRDRRSWHRIRRSDTRDVSATRARARGGPWNPHGPTTPCSGIPLALSAIGVAKQILVVDDEAYLRDVHVLVLSAAGYAATALATAVEALTRLADIRPDLILLDMSLPGMDGREFLKRLRASALWRRLPVILSSGFPTDDIAALAETNTEVLAKPFTDVALLTRVRGL